MGQVLSGFPQASHPADQEPTTHVGVGTGHEHGPETTPSTSTDPPICVFSRNVRPRVASFPPGFAPRRPGADDARQGGDRPSSTDLELHAQHHIGLILQSGSSLTACDLVVATPNVRIFGRRPSGSIAGQVGGPAFQRVTEPVLAGSWLAPTGACDESDDPRAGTGVIGLPRLRWRRRPRDRDRRIVRSPQPPVADRRSPARGAAPPRRRKSGVRASSTMSGGLRVRGEPVCSGSVSRACKSKVSARGARDV